MMLQPAYAFKNSTTILRPVNNHFSRSMQAEFLLARQQQPQAVALYQHMAFETLTPSLLERALTVSIDAHDEPGALSIARYWVEHEPQDTPAQFYLAHLALKTHDYPLAAQTLDKILNVDADVALDQVLAGIYPESEQDRQQLLNALMHLDMHDNPSLLVLMAGLQAQNGQLDDALKRINRALKKRSDVTAFMTLKANILMAQGKHRELAQWLDRQTRLQSTNKSLQLFEVRYLLKQDEQQKALKKLDNMIKRWPDDSEILLLAGLVSIDEKQHDKAERYLGHLLQQEAYMDQAYYYLGINAQRQHKFEQAASYYKKVEGTLYQSAQKKLAIMLVAQQALAPAISYLTQERVNHPEAASFLYQLQVQLLKDHGQLDAARLLLDEALENVPDDPELIYARVLLLKPTEQELLDQELERLLSIEPNSPTYLNAYAYTLATQNRRLHDARQLAERANALAPNQPAILDTLGLVAFLQQDYSTAVQVLQKALSLGDNLNIALRLVKTYQAAGDNAAYQQLKTQLQTRHPDNQQVIALQ
ncbi:tetratricopeptide repeat protein [Alkanindiges sp. WGS2144]|uniref:tetratricopeptide repeat protein n=1 Tax=Alkanindiges sp. WGS2144 TaxID=3366808 RepID=UPI003751BB9C